MKPVLLAIMDGFGLAPDGPGNAISLANKPFYDDLWATCPHPTLGASGRDVGLPDGQMGNSEVGHLNMGSERVVHQELTRINDACEDGSIEENEVLIEAIDKAVASGNAVHFLGLLSDGGVHSNMAHLEALIKMAAKRGARDLRVHAFMDGRDVDPKSGAGYMQRLIDYDEDIFFKYQGTEVSISTISGRYYAMDRDRRWDRVQTAWTAIAMAGGKGFGKGRPVQAINASYNAGITDEFIIPTVLDHRGVRHGDTMIFFNFRPDRAREITRTFCADEFDGFDRGARKNVKYICFTEYDVTIPNKEVAFKKVELKNTFGEYLAAHGMTQARIAETEKYAHVTFFFNGGVEEPNVGEDRILVKSPKVATYDLQPEMSAPEVCEKLCTAIRSEKYDVIVINFANPDMVGHTGIIPAAIKAIETVDSCVGKAVEALKEVDGQMFICADHGNAEQMVDYETGAPFTAHTTNPVPFILVNADPSYTLRENGCLADIIRR